jgi:hypothetical protein
MEGARAFHGNRHLRRIAGAALAVWALAAASAEAAPLVSLPDGRGWELVSPVDKSGGEVAAPEALFGGGVLQAAAQGGAVTYGSASSFGSAQGAPGAGQYLSRRGAGGWSTENLTVPMVSGGYDTSPGAGVPYRLFSADLESALLSNGRRCRGAASACPVANPPLPGSGAPAGYRNYYLRGSSGAFAALLGGGDVAGIEPQDFEVALAGASADLSQVVLSSCSALTATATEVPGAGGECDPAAQNLYCYSAQGLSLINLLPGQAQGTPGATLAAQGGAGALTPSRAYFTVAGNLYLREGNETLQVDAALAGGGTFELASADGAVAFFSKGAHLYRYEAPGGTLTDLTPGGGVTGVLGASADGAYLYYLSAAGVFLRHGATTTLVAAGGSAAAPSSYPAATGSARVSADGTRLAFLSAAALNGFDPKGATEVYLYSTAGGLRCVSCNSGGKVPLGPASIPGAVANGSSLRVYKPRALSASGNRLFFDTKDALLAADVNKAPDVYQWEAQGSGSCAAAGGCVDLISSGRNPAGATFVDASADGADVFFLTDESLVPSDPSAVDLYDARVGGGFPVPEAPIDCIGDACQAVPGVAEDPTPGTSLARAVGNPPLSFPKPKKPHRKKHHHKKRHRGSDSRRTR